MKFKQLDLNLLRVLVALHRSGSVTGAGHLLALSQPATSHLLAKLRESFGDELFLRTSKGLKPTPLCERLAPAIQSQLQALESLLTEEQAFDPATQAMDWRVSLSDLGEMMFLPMARAMAWPDALSELRSAGFVVAALTPADDALELASFEIGRAHV